MYIYIHIHTHTNTYSCIFRMKEMLNTVVSPIRKTASHNSPWVHVSLQCALACCSALQWVGNSPSQVTMGALCTFYDFWSWIFELARDMLTDVRSLPLSRHVRIIHLIIIQSNSPLGWDSADIFRSIPNTMWEHDLARGGPGPREKNS